MADGSQSDLQRLALKIVEDERRVGHNKLADQLDAILKQSRPRTNGAHALAAVPPERNLFELPLSKRHGDSLATLLKPETLEHHMVLPRETEERFARIESEYAARDRLASFGLRPRRTILLYGPPGCGKSLGGQTYRLEHRIAPAEGTFRRFDFFLLWGVRFKSSCFVWRRQRAPLRFAVGRMRFYRSF